MIVHDKRPIRWIDEMRDIFMLFILSSLAVRAVFLRILPQCGYCSVGKYGGMEFSETH
jgi:hypothetical protein